MDTDLQEGSISGSSTCALFDSLQSRAVAANGGTKQQSLLQWFHAVRSEGLEQRVLSTQQRERDQSYGDVTMDPLHPEQGALDHVRSTHINAYLSLM